MFVILLHRNMSSDSRDRIVVSTSRCGRDNPGSNPGHGSGCAVAVTAEDAFFPDVFFKRVKPFNFSFLYVNEMIINNTK